MSQLPVILPASSEAVATLLSRYCLPLGLVSSIEVDPTAAGIKRATFTLLRLKHRDVFVTCWHVLQELREMKKTQPLAEPVAYVVYPPSDLGTLNGFSLIDSDQRSLDVAVFGGQEAEVDIPTRNFIDYETSYLPDPQVGELVIIVGYPACNTEVTPGRAAFDYMVIGFRASSVSERQIKLANEMGDRQFFDYDDPNRTGLALGGLSGSPAFVIRDMIARFVGIVTDCSDSERTVDQTILISRLGCLNPDGTLDHTLIAW